MTTTTTVLNILIRALGIVQIILGLVFWTGNAYNLVTLHMSLGSLLVLCLWILAIVAIFARVPWQMVLFAFVWGLIVVMFGMRQAAILPGPFHWIIRVLHLLVGFAALGIADYLARRIHAKRAERILA